MSEDYKEDSEDNVIDAMALEAARIQTKEESALANAARGSSAVQQGSRLQLDCRRLLRGHFGKVYSAKWAPDSRRVISGGAEGKLIVWNAQTNRKLHYIPIQSPKILTVNFSPSGRYAVSGGLDNKLTVYDLEAADRILEEKMSRPDAEATEQKRFGAIYEPLCELYKHKGYVSSNLFVRGDDSTILTGSGDSKVFMWDFESRQVKSTFAGHLGDVSSLASNDEKTFLSASIDTTTKLWDVREEKPVMSFYHFGEVNCVAKFPGGDAFATASEDGTVRLFDTRSARQLQLYEAPRDAPSARNKAGGAKRAAARHQQGAGNADAEPDERAATALTFSKSGRYLFTSFNGPTIFVWDTLTGSLVTELRGNDNVHTIDMAPDGSALCSGSWDRCVRIWA